MFPAKISNKFLQNKEKTLLLVIFAQREFFLKTLAKHSWLNAVQLSLQHLYVKDIESIGRQTKNYSITISMQKSINQSIHQIICETHLI